MTIYLSLLIALIGAVVYFVVANPKAQELARLSFACGLLAFLLKVTESTINILGR